MLVFEHKVVDYKYFMDEMNLYEVNDIISNMKYNERNDWERARLITYMVGATQTKNIKKPSDVVVFPWDDDYKEQEKKKAIPKTGFKPTTDKDIERMMNLAKKWR